MSLSNVTHLDLSDSDAVAADRAIRRFATSAKKFSAKREELLRQYPNKWGAVYHGNVVASSSDLDTVIRLLAERGIPANETAVRFMDRKRRTLILPQRCFEDGSMAKSKPRI